MSNVRKGSRIRLSPARKMVLELLHHARRVPSLAHAKELNIAAVVDVRNALAQPPSWLAIFIRAYGLLCQQHAELRQAFIPWPYPHIYEHPHSECTIPIEREWEGEQVVLGARIRAPEAVSIDAIQDHLRSFKETPVLQVSSFRQILRLGRMPGFIRRFTFWQTLYVSGYKRAKRFGSFIISSLGNLGVQQLTVLTPLTTYFTFGPINAAGDVLANIIYDHRVMDGRTVARCLVDLEKILHNEILSELRGMQSRTAA